MSLLTLNVLLASGGGPGGGGAVSGLIGQWQSDVGVTVSGSEVTAVADQGAHGNNLTKIATTGPTLVAGVLNGFAGIRHAAGTDHRLQVTAPTGLAGISDCTIVVVHSPYNTTSAGSLTMYDVNNGLAHVNIGNGQNGDYRVGGPYNGVWPGTNAVWRGNSVVNTFDIVMAVRASGVLTFYKNGAVLTPTTTHADGTSGTGTITIGGDFTGNVGAGTWTQQRVYDHALDATERSTVFSALATKYGLSTLTSSGTALSRTGWTATAYADGGGGFVPASAIDSNLGTRYLSAAGVTAGSSWFKIDMASAQTVGGVQVDNNPQNGGGWSLPTAGDVQWSDDNSSWTTVASWSLGTVPTTIQASWTPVSHRYWRLLAQGGSADGGWWSIGELYFYSDAAP
jgi:hypothetical protein